MGACYPGLVKTVSERLLRTLRYTYILVMTFKRQRQANIAMPANTAMPMFLTSCDTETHIYIYIKQRCLCVCLSVHASVVNG